MFSYILYKYTYMCVVECEPTFLENKVLFLFFFPNFGTSYKSFPFTGSVSPSDGWCDPVLTLISVFDQIPDFSHGTVFFPGLDWRASGQNPLAVRFSATCPVNAVTDGSLLHEQLRRPESTRTSHHLDAASKDFSSGADKTLSRGSGAQTSDSHQLRVYSCQPRMCKLFYTFHS